MEESGKARETALQIVTEVEKGAYADRALNMALGKVNLDPRDTRLVTELVNGSLRMRAYIDWILNVFTKGGIEKLPPHIRNALRLGVYQILFLNKIPHAVAVNETVALAKRFGHPGTANLVNAVLRKVAKGDFSEPSLDDDPVASISILSSHPDWMVRRWLEKYGVEETRNLCQANNRIPDVVLRVNSLKVSFEEAVSYLAENGVGTRESPFLRGYLHLQKKSELGRQPVFEKGWFVAQDESAGFPALLLDPQPNERVLDLCSAPGGKTTHIAQLMQDQGTVLAVDISGDRLRLVEENCIRLGIKSVETIETNGTQFQAVPFDRILVDAPCSGTGVLARRPDARWRKRERHILQLPELQGRLLDNAAQLLKKDGVLVYSTCSIEDEENEEVIGAVLERHPELTFEDARSFVPDAVISPEGYVRTFPHRHRMDGSFAARVRKAR